MSRAALERVERMLTDGSFYASKRRDLRTVVRLAKRAMELEAALQAVAHERDFVVRCNDHIQGVVAEALAPRRKTLLERLAEPGFEKRVAEARKRLDAMDAPRRKGKR